MIEPERIGMIRRFNRIRDESLRQNEAAQLNKIRKVEAVLDRITGNYESENGELFDDLLHTIVQAVATSEYYATVMAFAYEAGVIEEDHLDRHDD